MKSYSGNSGMLLGKLWPWYKLQGVLKCQTFPCWTLLQYGDTLVVVVCCCENWNTFDLRVKGENFPSFLLVKAKDPDIFNDKIILTT